MSPHRFHAFKAAAWGSPGFWDWLHHVSDFALAHQNRTIAIASDFRVDGAKSPEILQKEGFGLRNRSPKSQIASDFPSHP